MAYIDLIKRLLAVNFEGGIKLGLQNVQKLQQLLNFPDRSFASIHVAGTNGKGSVCIKMARALEEAGYKVGLYTSPHLSCFRERIRVNGEMIAEHAVESLLPRLFHLTEQEKIPATFFEITTFLAFLHFANEKIDVAILETGLGGRLDATNVVTPCLSIITSISLDHTEILGTTKEQIAYEKGGIIKDNVPVIIGPHVPLPPVLKIANQKHSPVLQVKETSSNYDDQNRQIAKKALEFLKPLFTLTFDAIEKGLTATQPCRFEILEGSPNIILDVAHNPDGIFHLFQLLEHRFRKRPLRLLLGLSKSKDVKACLEMMVPYSSCFHLIESINGRAAPKEHLKEHLLQLSIDKESIFLHDTIAEGLQIAKAEALKHNQILVIFGTFFIMAEVRRILNYDEPFDAFELNERNLKKSCQDKATSL